MGYATRRRGRSDEIGAGGGSSAGGPPLCGAALADRHAFLDGARAFHREHGVVDVLAVVGRQRLIRVQLGRSRSEIAVLAVHVDELSAVDRLV